jgi:methoxymalonate biosynthesis protein
MADPRAKGAELLTALAGADQAEEWDRTGAIPREVVEELSAAGVLCGQVPEEYGGLGLSALDNGLLTAHAGTLCASLRSLMTSQGIAAWTLERWGTAAQRERWLPRLTGGATAAVALSEEGAGSDLSAMRTRVEHEGGTVRLTGTKTWVTGAAYADLIVVFGRYGDGVAAVLVPTDAPGLTIDPVPDPLGCRAAGHSFVHLDGLELDEEVLLPGAGGPLGFVAQSALTYGRLSVAWGCLGMISSCLTAAARHAAVREQFGKPLAQHQLVAGRIGDMVAAEQVATRVCEHAARCWDQGSAELVTAALVAKHVTSTEAARVAASAVQVLGSAGARDGRPVARAYRDAKLMEIIEGTSELCRLELAGQALVRRS